MKIFVTGGAGFIGRHLVKSLLKQGHIITIFDNFSNSSLEAISELIESGVKVVKGDIRNYETLLDSTKGYDFVIHLAAKIDVKESVKNPQEVNEVNVTGTVNLLRACVENGVKNLIAASSAAVYGDCKSFPIQENFFTNPVSPYGASKIAMEHYLQAFSNCYDLNCISLRFFNIYGKGQSSAYAGVITKFMERIEVGKSLKIFGDGMATRDLVSVTDVVHAIQLGMKKIQGKKGNYYNIASGKYTSVKDLANLMITISNQDLSIDYFVSREGDIANSQASIELAQKELRYSPKVDLSDGLQQMLNLSKPIEIWG